MPIIPSSLCFVNKSDPIHCAKSYLDQCWQAQGWISWSLTRAVWVTSWGNDSQAPGFSCWRRCFPLRSRAVKQNVLLVWQGVKGSRLHLPVEGNLERGKWGLMEKIENRNERNSLPLLLLARSDSSPPYIFYSSTVVYHTGPGPVRQISRRSFFCGGFCHFIDWEDDFFFFFFVCGAWRKVKYPLSLHADTWGHCAWFCQLSGFKQKWFCYVPEDIVALPFSGSLLAASLNVL